MISRKIFTDEDIANIIYDYNHGLSSTKIGKQYDVGHKVILKILHKNGVNVDGNKFRRKYNLNEQYFDDIDTQNKAYILGLLYADGSNNIKKSTISISLQEEDFEILEKIRNVIGSEKELEYLNYENKHDFGYTYKNQYRLLMFSSYMCKSLERIGMVQNKSLVLKFPVLRNDLYKHFIRGYFDGDGSYCPNTTKGGKFQPLITFTSTDEFCKSLQKYLKSELNIPCGNIYEASCCNNITKVLSFSGRLQVKIFLDWLYEDAELYMQRKYNKYKSSEIYLNNSLVA